MLLQLQMTQNTASNHDVEKPQTDVRSVFLLDGSTQFIKLHIAKIRSEEMDVKDSNNDFRILKNVLGQHAQGVRTLFALGAFLSDIV